MLHRSRGIFSRIECVITVIQVQENKTRTTHQIKCQKAKNRGRIASRSSTNVSVSTQSTRTLCVNRYYIGPEEFSTEVSVELQIYRYRAKKQQQNTPNKMPKSKKTVRELHQEPRKAHRIKQHTINAATYYILQRIGSVI